MHLSRSTHEKVIHGLFDVIIVMKDLPQTQTSIRISLGAVASKLLLSELSVHSYFMNKIVKGENCLWMNVVISDPLCFSK